MNGQLMGRRISGGQGWEVSAGERQVGEGNLSRALKWVSEWLQEAGVMTVRWGCRKEESCEREEHGV